MVHPLFLSLKHSILLLASGWVSLARVIMGVEGGSEMGWVEGRMGWGGVAGGWGGGGFKASLSIFYLWIWIFALICFWWEGGLRL